jgi:hypothetical protein
MIGWWSSRGAVDFEGRSVTRNGLGNHTDDRRVNVRHCETPFECSSKKQVEGHWDGVLSRDACTVRREQFVRVFVRESV